MRQSVMHQGKQRPSTTFWLSSINVRTFYFSPTLPISAIAVYWFAESFRLTKRNVEQRQPLMLHRNLTLTFSQSVGCDLACDDE